MALYVYTDNPQGLLANIKAAIADGTIRTWEVDKDGDFTHATDQWRYAAWLRPRIEKGELRFIILAPVGKGMAREVYAIYHGRFLEAVLAHFDTQFSSARASAMPEAGDML
jgi:hypothetical protein